MTKWSRFSFAALAAAGALALAAPAAHADFISTLNTTSDTALGSGPFGTVDVSLSGDVATITFTAAAGFTFQDSNIADVQSSDPNAVCTAVTAGLECTGASGNIDHIGDFNQTTKLTTSPPQGSPIVFTLTSSSFTDVNTVLTTNSVGLDAGAHVLLLSSGGTVTGFVGEIPPGPSVPEPASLALLGAGLLGVGAVVRRRKGKSV